jgi:hypothetical protein
MQQHVPESADACSLQSYLGTCRPHIKSLNYIQDKDIIKIYQHLEICFVMNKVIQHKIQHLYLSYEVIQYNQYFTHYKLIYFCNAMAIFFIRSVNKRMSSIYNDVGWFQNNESSCSMNNLKDQLQQCH